MKWDLKTAGRITGGTVFGDAVIDSVSIDSRTIAPGGLFVAVRGDMHDGHDFIEQARLQGAGAVIAEVGRLGAGPGIEVSDTLDALRTLAIARRDEISCPVVAVTGSSGKTTTKDFIAAVLGTGTHASPRSFNNEFGVPLTILGVPDDATTVVVEVGSRGPGHIAHLGPAIRPHVAVITNVGPAHLEMFGSVDGVIEAKWELIETLPADGVAVLPAGEQRLLDRTTDRVVTFGEGVAADVEATDVEIDEVGRASFTLSAGSDSARLRMPLPGRHQPVNAAAAVAAALALGRPFAEAATRLEDATVSPWRMELVTIEVGEGQAVVLNDAYNANPDSMRAALDTVVAMPGRHIAVLGKMHELGALETEAHREAGAAATSMGFTVLAVGDDPGIAEGAGKGTAAVADAATAVEWLWEMMAPGDVVLVKASRAAGLEAVVTGLQRGNS